MEKVRRESPVYYEYRLTEEEFRQALGIPADESIISMSVIQGITITVALRKERK